MLARFIVFTTYPSAADADKREATLTHLANLIQATESYYHPSNYGRWSYHIVNFLRQLSWEFLKRWRDEQTPECTTPAFKRLTLAIRHEFVLILRSVTFLSLFGKDQYSVSASQATIKYLAWLEPSLIFPGLLERIYPSLETLTETHRTNSSLSALSHVINPLLSRTHYPAGGKHLVPLLHLTIPGIDMNDPIKTIASLMFITHAIMNVPIKDLTQGAGVNAGSGGRFVGMDVSEGGAAMETDEVEEDALCQASTGEFEEWVAKFLRRVFTIFENLPNQDNKKQSANMETGLVQILLHACEVLFFQLSDELHDMALRMIVDFATTTILPNAVRAMGELIFVSNFIYRFTCANSRSRRCLLNCNMLTPNLYAMNTMTGFLCATITSPNPAKALKQFIPLCLSNISSELSHGAASTPTTSASNVIQSDSTLHWYQSILFQVAMVAGADLLDYKTEIIEITKEMISKCFSRRGYTWAGKFIRYTLVSLTEVYPLECRSVDPETWKDPEFLNNHHKYWGKPGNPKKLNIQWHVPSNAELDFALELLDAFFTTSVNRLKKLIAGIDVPMSTKEMSNEFCRHLSVLRNFLLGTTTMVADDGEDIQAQRKMEVEGDEDSSAIHPVKQLCGAYCFTNPVDPRTHKARTIRRELGQFLHELVVYFRANREDDVESLKIVIKMYKSYLTERGVEKRKYEVIARGYDYAKTLVKTAYDDKAYPRYLLVRRAYTQHLLRLKQNAYGRVRTQLHDNMLFDLTELSLSSYSEIRKINAHFAYVVRLIRLAQSALTNSVRCYIGSKPKVVPLLLNALQPDIGMRLFI
ncbi:hypothetical protein BC936DRAFT_141627 [Jimgerdemannia flammicorona]|uniref:Proteasome activator Blm10 middle HEAT repeats region domain-containing protein n=1 Tax=Jimgerdemannia flammicorona TaxID=994334 RepID=A0A433A1W8_9FUNG|nr:hypothetical protein BC936DRAFT_141627 [Jimgerdemannia flammicorona]